MTLFFIIVFFILLFLFLYWQFGGFSWLLTTSEKEGCEIVSANTEGLSITLPGLEGNLTVARLVVDAHDDPLKECLWKALNDAAKGDPGAIVVKDVNGKGSSVAIKTSLIKLTKQLETLLGEKLAGTQTKVGAYYVWVVTQ